MSPRSIKETLEEVIDQLIDTRIYWPEVSQEFEKLFLMKALFKSEGNVQKAAEIMGVHRNTLSKKIREYGVDRSKIRRESREAKARKK